MLYRLTRNPDDLFVAPYQQYFHPHVQPVEHETVIDGGAFIGDTVKKFMDKQSGNLRIYSFEPCKDTFEKLTSFIKENQLGQVVTPIGEGLADKRNFAYLNKRNPKNPAGYRIVNNSSEVTEDIRINSLDNIVDEFQIKRIDLIKLDIEGSELVAILGAEQTIKKHAPKLQICLYHKPKDIFELPLLIEEMFKEHRYTYYFGHHHRGPWETVLYAIPAKR
nr:FkbM family methyltransferase [Cohnella thailandensis]